MASHAYTTTPLLRPTSSDRWGLLLTGSARRPGPVTIALKAMHAADPDRQRLAELRQAIADRIEADLALLDQLDGDPDFEIELPQKQHDAENVDWRMLGGQAA